MPIFSPSDRTGKPIVRTTNRPYGWWVFWQSNMEDNVSLVFDAADGKTQTKSTVVCNETDILVLGGQVNVESTTSNISINTGALIPPSEVEESTEGNSILVDHPVIPNAHIIVPAESGTHNILKYCPLDSDDSQWNWDYLDGSITPATIDEEGVWTGEYALMDVGVRLKNIINIELGNGTFEFTAPDPMKFHKNHKLEVSIDFGSNTTGTIRIILIFYSKHIETEIF